MRTVQRATFTVALALLLAACTESWRGGIHAVLRFRPQTNTVLIERVASNGPSARSGLRIGDELIAIDDVPVSSMTEQDLRQRLPGEVGSTVRLRIRRDGAEREVTVERAPYTDRRP